MSTGVARPTRLPRATVLWYALPAFAGAAMGTPIAIHLAQFYTDEVLAPIAAVAVGVALARALDALIDPPLGWLSDRTRTRFGRRKPFIAVGVPLAALAFVALFAPPATLAPRAAAAWFSVTFALFFFVHSIREVAYGALGLELSADYHERSTLFGIQALAVAGGTIVATFLPAVLMQGVGVPRREAFAGMALLYAVILVVLNALLLARVPEPSPQGAAPGSPFVPGVRRALRNRPFRILLLAGVLNAVPASIPAVLMPYYTRYVLRPANPDLWLALLVFTFLATGFVCLPLWMGLARRIGKRATLLVAGTIGTTGSVLFFFAGPGDEWRVLCYEMLVGTQSQVGWFLVPAMAADVVDYDALRTGRRREAQFAAFWGLVPKLVAIPSAALPLAVLGALGYVPNHPQTPEVLLALRLLFGIFPAVFYVAALCTVARYPISEAVHRDIREGLAAHSRGAAARDPLTAARLPPPGMGAVDEATGWLLDTFSRRELTRALRDGPRRVVRDVTAAAAVTAAGTVVAAAAAARQIAGIAAGRIPATGDASSLATVLAIVGAGLGVTATVFHLLRLPAARQLAALPDARHAVAAHLDAALTTTPPGA